MQIQAAVCRATNGPLTLENLELAQPRDDEILVRVAATGICHTDIGMIESSGRVPKPIVLGHEGAGVVEKVGAAVTKVKPGDHVVMSFNSCGHCPSCFRGDRAYCQTLNDSNFSGARPDGSTALAKGGEVIYGHFFNQSAFATHAICSQRNAVLAPKDIPLELLGPLGCGFQTGAGSVINAFRVHAGAAIGIFGVGSVGLAAVMAAKAVGAGVIVAVDTQPSRLAIARRLGATHVINPKEQDTFAQLRAIVPAGMNYALDTSGHLGSIHDAVNHLAVRGVLGLISSAKGADVSVNALQMLLGGRSVRGIHQGDSVPDIFIPQMIDMYRRGQFPFDQLITYYELAQINEAIADMHSGKTIKPVIRMPTGQTTSSKP